MKGKNDFYKKSELSKSVETFLKKRNAKELLFTINPKTSALLVIDMQSDFLDEGAPLWQPHYKEIVTNVGKLIEFCREQKIPVIWSIEVRSPYGYDSGLIKDVLPLEGKLVKGSEGAKIYKGLPQPLDSEEVIEKRRYSVFFQTDLELLLRNMGVDTLIITGLHSNICAQTTSRDGFMRDFQIAFVSDGTAANPPALHEAACLEIMVAFGRVLSTDEVMREIKSQR